MEILNNYFQRYSEKENVVTDNTMRLLGLLKEYNIKLYNKFLECIKIVDEEQKLDIKIVIQERENSKKNASIPDAILTQVGYKIVVEAKLENNFEISQLRNHLNEFSSNNENKILLTIGKEKMHKNIYEEITSECSNINVRHINLTYSDIIRKMYDIIPENDRFIDVVKDYEVFCKNNNILEMSHNKLYVFTSNVTKNINLKYSLYFRKQQNYEAFDYLGLYSNKRVEYIGKVESIVSVEAKGDQVIIDDFNLEDEKKERIFNAIVEINNLGDEDKNMVNEGKYYFYLIKKYVPTNFEKITPNPIMGRKLFDLKEVLSGEGEINKLSIEHIAEMLMYKTW